MNGPLHVPRQWVKCPYCASNQKTNNYTQEASCDGVWTKCKTCRREFVIRIQDGKQING